MAFGTYDKSHTSQDVQFDELSGDWPGVCFVLAPVPELSADDVVLPAERLAECVLTRAEHLVEDAAQGEHVHSTCLWCTGAG